MEEQEAVLRLNALAQSKRLSVFSMLAQAGLAGLTASELAQRSSTPTNTMSNRVVILTRAGRGLSRRLGGKVFCSAAVEKVRQFAAYLIKDCRGGCGAWNAELDADVALARVLGVATNE
jgi:ArsR family transcriptional regulator